MKVRKIAKRSSQQQLANGKQLTFSDEIRGGCYARDEIRRDGYARDEIFPKDFISIADELQPVNSKRWIRRDGYARGGCLKSKLRHLFSFSVFGACLCTFLLYK